MTLIKRTVVYPNIVVKDFLWWNKFGDEPWRMVIRDGGVDPALIAVFLAGFSAGMAVAVLVGIVQ